MVDGLQREIPRHELDDRFEAVERRTDANARETGLCNRRIDNSIGAPLLQQVFRHLAHDGATSKNMNNEKNKQHQQKINARGKVDNNDANNNNNNNNDDDEQKPTL